MRARARPHRRAYSNHFTTDRRFAARPAGRPIHPTAGRSPIGRGRLPCSALMHVLGSASVEMLLPMVRRHRHRNCLSPFPGSDTWPTVPAPIPRPTSPFRPCPSALPTSTGKHLQPGSLLATLHYRPNSLVISRQVCNFAGLCKA